MEHHGDTPVIFFYQKALEESDDQLVDIDDFRYDGQRPHSKESAIIMLADTVEAAVRSMPDPTTKTIRAYIEKLVSNKILDGQLSQAPITLSDIDKISEAFATVLNGVFHERIEYPDPPVKRQRAKEETVSVQPVVKPPVHPQPVNRQRSTVKPKAALPKPKAAAAKPKSASQKKKPATSKPKEPVNEADPSPGK